MAAKPRRKISLSLICFAIILLIISGVSLAIWIFPVLRESAPDPQVAMSSDPDMVKVQRWLNRKLGAGTWEELEWWPCPDLKTLCDKRISKLRARCDIKRSEIAILNRKEGNNTQIAIRNFEKLISVWEGQIEDLKAISIRRFCGIRISAADSHGGNGEQTKLFDTSTKDAVELENLDDPISRTVWKFLKQPTAE